MTRFELLPEACGRSNARLTSDLRSHVGQLIRGETRVLAGPDVPARCVHVDHDRGRPVAARWRERDRRGRSVGYWCDEHKRQKAGAGQGRLQL